jgi:hypothetical protein
MISPWFTISSAAEYAHCSEWLVRNAIKQKKLRGSRLGNSPKSSWLIHHKYLDAWILGYGTRLTRAQHQEIKQLGENNEEK